MADQREEHNTTTHICSVQSLTTTKSTLFLVGLIVSVAMTTVCQQWFLTHDVSDTVTYEEHQLIRPCSQKYRRNLIRHTCDVYHAHDVEDEHVDKSLDVVALNHEKKLFFCALPKSGSKSWLIYMVNLTGNASESPWHVRDKDFMRDVGLDYRKKIPVREVLEKYQDYTKFTVVRHPIQWIVAVYFETVHRLGKYSNPDGSKVTLQQFVNKLESYPRFKKYWRNFEKSCHHCTIRYDYVIKAETVRDDGDMLREVLGSDVLPPFVHVNERYPSGPDWFKYDNLLRDLERNQTNSVQKLVTYYEKDMKMFGYLWDDLNQSSLCHNRDEQGACC